MLHIILLILKIIGMILLVFLGFLLTVLLIILLVPIRYQVRVVHGENLRIEGRVSWLLHVIHGRISQVNEERHIRIRIFGFVFYDNQKPVKPKKVKKKQKQRRKTRKVRVTPISKKELHDYKEEYDSYGEPNVTQEDMLGHDEGNQRYPSVKKKDKSPNTVYSDNNGSKPSILNREPSGTEADVLSGDSEEEYGYNPKSESFFSKFINQVKVRILGVKEFFNRVKRKIKNFILKLFSVKHKLDKIKAFLQDEINQEAFKISISSIVKLIKHILPTKLKSRVVFGTGDPCSTGQALGVLGILYSFYGDNIQIIPDFENRVFEGSHYAKGRIRLVTILIIVIKLLIDKKFKQFMRNFKILKEAL